MDQRRGSIFPNLKSISFRYKTLLKSLYWNTPNLEYFVTIQGSTKVVFVSRYKFWKKKTLCSTIAKVLNHQIQVKYYRF